MAEWRIRNCGGSWQHCDGVCEGCTKRKPEFIDSTKAQYIDTGIRPDQIEVSRGDALVFLYECVPYWHRHFAAKVAEDINAESCKAIREHLFEQGYTDVLLMDDAFIQEAIGKALAERKDGGGDG